MGWVGDVLMQRPGGFNLDDLIQILVVVMVFVLAPLGKYLRDRYGQGKTGTEASPGKTSPAHRSGHPGTPESIRPGRPTSAPRQTTAGGQRLDPPVFGHPDVAGPVPVPRTARTSSDVSIPSMTPGPVPPVPHSAPRRSGDRPALGSARRGRPPGQGPAPAKRRGSRAVSGSRRRASGGRGSQSHLGEDVERRGAALGDLDPHPGSVDEQRLGTSIGRAGSLVAEPAPSEARGPDQAVSSYGVELRASDLSVAGLRRAIVMAEILGPPLALREDDPWGIL